MTQVISSDPFEQELGNIIRHLRISRGLSQHELGAPIGISFQQIQKYEKGVNRISVSRFIELAKTLEMSPLAILSTHSALGEAEPLIADITYLPTKENITLLKFYQTIPKGRSRKLIFDLTRLLAERIN